MKIKYVSIGLTVLAASVLGACSEVDNPDDKPQVLTESTSDTAANDALNGLESSLELNEFLAENPEVDPESLEVETANDSIVLQVGEISAAEAAQYIDQNTRASNQCRSVYYYAHQRLKTYSIFQFARKYKLYLDTNAWLGAPGNPDACGRPAYRTSQMRHYGAAFIERKYGSNPVKAYPGSIRVQTARQAINESYIASTGKGSWSSGETKVCGMSKHYLTVSGRNYKIYLKSKYCYFDWSNYPIQR